MCFDHLPSAFTSAHQPSPQVLRSESQHGTVQCRACPEATGAAGRGAQVDLGAAMDPRRLMESAVDLNLRLMLWRAAPSLDLPALAATRCLLLGAGAGPLCCLNVPGGPRWEVCHPPACLCPAKGLL